MKAHPNKNCVMQSYQRNVFKILWIPCHEDLKLFLIVKGGPTQYLHSVPNKVISKCKVAYKTMQQFMFWVVLLCYIFNVPSCTRPANPAWAEDFFRMAITASEGSDPFSDAKNQKWRFDWQVISRLSASVERNLHCVEEIHTQKQETTDKIRACKKELHT